MLSARDKQEGLRKMSYPEIVEEVKRLPFHEQLLLMEVLARAPCNGKRRPRARLRRQWSAYWICRAFSSLRMGEYQPTKN